MGCRWTTTYPQGQTADVGNAQGWLTKMQALEYLVQQEVERRAWDALGALPVVPGAVGAVVGAFASPLMAAVAGPVTAAVLAQFKKS